MIGVIKEDDINIAIDMLDDCFEANLISPCYLALMAKKQKIDLFMKPILILGYLIMVYKSYFFQNKNLFIIGLSGEIHKIKIQAVATGGSGIIQTINLLVYTFI